METSEGRIEIGEKGMAGILFTKDSISGINPPVYAEGGVSYGDTPVSLRGVKIVTFVLEHRSIAKHSKAMSKAARDEKLKMILLG